MHPAQAPERDRLPARSAARSCRQAPRQNFANADATTGLPDARHLAAQLKAAHPDAAGSLLEGLEEMFTVAQLDITGALHRSLTNTNCIESTIWTVRVVSHRVNTRKGGEMKKRWIATGVIEDQRSFRRVKRVLRVSGLDRVE